MRHLEYDPAFGGLPGAKRCVQGWLDRHSENRRRIGDATGGHGGELRRIESVVVVFGNGASGELKSDTRKNVVGACLRRWIRCAGMANEIESFFAADHFEDRDLGVVELVATVIVVAKFDDGR